MVLSFYSHILNRAWQFHQTVEVNLQALKGTRHEWVLLDLSSDDGLVVPSHENLTVIKIPRPKEYSIAYYKNYAASLCTGEYLFNLDVDNYISKELIDYIERHPNQAIRDASNYRGSEGRIGCPSWLFRAVRGYPNLEGVRGDDVEFVSRLKEVTDVVVPGLEATPPVPNTAQDSVRYTAYDTIAECELENSNAVHSQPPHFPDLSVALNDPWVRSRRYREIRKMGYGVEFPFGFSFMGGGVLPGIGSTGASSDFSAHMMWTRDGHPALRITEGGVVRVLPFKTKFDRGHLHTIEFRFFANYIQATVNGESVECRINARQCTLALYHVIPTLPSSQSIRIQHVKDYSAL